MKNLFLILLTFILFACSKDNSNEVNIRLSNASNVAFESATFNNINYGDLAPNQISEYRIFERAYNYGSVSITIEGEVYGWTPIDFVGEEPLENGNYTFEYYFDTNTKILTDRLIKE